MCSDGTIQKECRSSVALMKYPQLRQDLISGDWVLISPTRSKRPFQFVQEHNSIRHIAKKKCPFEDPAKSGNVPSLLVLPSKGPWKLQISPNKYPAVIHEEVMAVFARQGPYLIAPGVGRHDVVITKDHNRNFPALPVSDANLLFQAFKRRYKMFLRDKYLAYAAIFHNWGPKAGASIYHPHYQIIALPVVPPDVEHSLQGSQRYFQKNQECVHCVQIQWEQEQKTRIIYENKAAVAFAPFVSRSPFEIRIFPKSHLPFFEETSHHELKAVVEVLHNSLQLMEKALNLPHYNFFIHTAPIQKKETYLHYHWHIEVIPKLTIPGGFELGTGVEINVVDPDEAATFIRK